MSDSPSKANGGLIGPISRDEMNEELLKMISKMKVGDITPVMNTATGAQFFKLESSIESTTLPFEAARARIADRLEPARRSAPSSRSTWQRLRAQAHHRVEERGSPKGVGDRHRGRTDVLDVRMSASWFAIWTRSRHEQVVREQIERKQFDAFLPTITRWSRWKDRKKKIDWPLFPGYCFARFKPEESLADPEMHRRRQHRVVRRKARADSRARNRRHPPSCSKAICSTTRAR